MPAEPALYHAGDIVLADWRGDARPSEPNILRRAIVVEDTALFARAYPNVILVPLTDDANLVIADLSVALLPTPENGCVKRCWAAAHLITTTSKSRLRHTQSHVTPADLAAIRRRIAGCVGTR